MLINHLKFNIYISKLIINKLYNYFNNNKNNIENNNLLLNDSEIIIKDYIIQIIDEICLNKINDIKDFLLDFLRTKIQKLNYLIKFLEVNKDKLKVILNLENRSAELYQKINFT